MPAVRFTVLLLWVASGSVLAQVAAPPLSGRILESQRPQEAPAAPLPSPPVLPLPSSPEAAPAAADGMRFTLRSVAFEGNTAIATSELEALLAPVIGHEVGLGELQQLASALAAHYAARGYLLVQVVLPPQRVPDGRVTFRVIEGFVDGVRVVQPSVRLADAQALRYAAAVAAVQPLPRAVLERPLLLLGRLPGLSAQAALEPGRQPGSSTVGLLLADEAPRQQLGFVADNFGSTATGELRAGLDATIDGLAGRGDRLALDLLTSEGGGIASGGLQYQLPLGVSGLQLAAGITHMTYTLGGPFASLDGHGEANDLHLRLSYPLWLDSAGSTELWGEYRYRQLRDVLDAVGDTNRRRIREAQLGISRSGFDAYGGWNHAQFSYGTGDLALRDAARAADAYGQHGFFSKANLLLTRQQYLGGRWSLQLTAQGQYAWQNLDSGAEFALGGPYSVRAYPVSELSGDQGWLAQWALHWQAADRLVLSVFGDRGRVRFNADELAGNPWDTQRLRSTGLGFDWQGPHGFALQGSWAWGGSYASRSDPGNTDGRFYFQLRKQF